MSSRHLFFLIWKKTKAKTYKYRKQTNQTIKKATNKHKTNMQQADKCKKEVTIKETRRCHTITEKTSKLYATTFPCWSMPMPLHVYIFISTLNLFANCFKGQNLEKAYVLHPMKQNINQWNIFWEMANMSHGYDIRAGTTTCATALHWSARWAGGAGAGSSQPAQWLPGLRHKRTRQLRRARFRIKRSSFDISGQ